MASVFWASHSFFEVTQVVLDWQEESWKSYQVADFHVNAPFRLLKNYERGRFVLIREESENQKGNYAEKACLSHSYLNTSGCFNNNSMEVSEMFSVLNSVMW